MGTPMLLPKGIYESVEAAGGMPCHARISAFRGCRALHTVSQIISIVLVALFLALDCHISNVPLSPQRPKQPVQGKEGASEQTKPIQHSAGSIYSFSFSFSISSSSRRLNYNTKTQQVLASPCDQIASRAHLHTSLGRGRGGGRGGGGRVGLVVGRLRRVDPALPVDRRVVGVVEPQRALGLDGRLCVYVYSNRFWVGTIHIVRGGAMFTPPP